MNNLLSLTDIGNSLVSALSGALGVWYVVLFNAFGVIAIIVKLLETQNKSRNKIVAFASIGYACWITYFVLNGNFTSAFVNAIGFVQCLIFMQRGKYKWADSIFWLIFFLVVQVVVSVFTFSDWRSMFAIVAGLISTVAYFVMSEKLYRYLFWALITLWLVNGFIYFYWIAVIHDAFAWISIVIAIFRYNIKGKTDRKEIVESKAEEN